MNISHAGINEPLPNTVLQQNSLSLVVITEEWSEVCNLKKQNVTINFDTGRKTEQRTILHYYNM